MSNLTQEQMAALIAQMNQGATTQPASKTATTTATSQYSWKLNPSKKTKFADNVTVAKGEVIPELAYQNENSGKNWFICEISGTKLRLNMDEVYAECLSQKPTLINKLCTKNDDGTYTWVGDLLIGIKKGEFEFFPRTL